jgi:hypothetical protein
LAIVSGRRFAADTAVWAGGLAFAGFGAVGFLAVFRGALAVAKRTSFPIGMLIPSYSGSDGR